MDIDLRAMHQVRTLAAEGSFAKAARVLHISQPTLSRSIQDVERKAGIKLFERGREGATLTDVGRIFLRHAEGVLTAAGDMDRELSMIQGLVSGELRVGAGVFPSELFVGEALGRMVKPHTATRIRIFSDPAQVMLARLRKREIDLGVADPSWLEHSTDVVAIPLSAREGHLVVRAGHPLLKVHPLTLERIIDYPLVTTSAAPPSISRIATKAVEAHQRQQRMFGRWIPTITADSIRMMKGVVACSDAVTLLCLHPVRHELLRGELAVLPLRMPWMKVTFAVMHLAHRSLTPLARAFIDTVIVTDRVLHAEELAVEEQVWGKGTPRRRGAGRAG